MLSIEDLQLYSKENPPIKTLGRKKEILDSYLKFNSTPENKNNFISNVHQNLLQNKYYLHLNDFPYNVEDNIEHWLLWWNNNLDIDEIIIKKFDNKVITYWVNFPENNSISDIKHAHIFVIS